MDDLLRHAKLILRSMWLYRRLGVAVAWVVGIVAAAVILSIPDKYEASARIYVDTDSVLAPLLAGIAIQPNTEQQIGVLSRTLISRPNVEKLVRMADLDLTLNNAEKESLIDSLMKTLQIKSAGRDNLYTLSFRDPNPTRATKIVQSLTTIFVESSLGDKRQDTDSAKKFLDEQIKTYEKKLDEAEARLKDFKLRNIDLSAASGGPDSFAKMGDLLTKLQQARLDLREAENSRDAIKRQILGEDPVLLPDSTSNSALASPELEGRIETMKRNLDGLLQRYTEQHPDVVGTRRMIKDLEEQKKEEVAARRKAAANNPGAGFSTNPLYQQLKVQLTEFEATVASLRVRVSEYESRYQQAKSSMKMLPEVEAELTQLNRDYEIHKKNYEGLVARRESATISGDMENVGGMADFRLIDPPRASSQPVAPNRMLLLPLALVAALAIGAAACFIAAQVRPTFSDARSLRDLTGLPFLGTITLIVSPEMKARERKSLVRFGVATSSLAIVYGLGMLVLLLIGTRGL